MVYGIIGIWYTNNRLASLEHLKCGKFLSILWYKMQLKSVFFSLISQPARYSAFNIKPCAQFKVMATSHSFLNSSIAILSQEDSHEHS